MKKVEKESLHEKAGKKQSQNLAHHGIFLYAELGNVKRVNVTGLLHTGSLFQTCKK